MDSQSKDSVVYFSYRSRPIVNFRCVLGIILMHGFDKNWQTITALNHHLQVR